jgi:hypothetical protein
MNRKTELQSMLTPWATLVDDVDYETCPDQIWERLLDQAPKLATISKFWFIKGLQRAIDEMERTIDGRPLHPTRQDLINHLKTIHVPH